MEAPKQQSNPGRYQEQQQEGVGNVVYSTVDKLHGGQRADQTQRELIHMMNERIGITPYHGHSRIRVEADDPDRRSYCNATLWLFYHGTTTVRPTSDR